MTTKHPCSDPNRDEHGRPSGTTATGPATLVTRAQFDTLRDTPLGVTDFLEQLLKNNAPALKKVRENRRNDATFASVASWAVWEPIQRGTRGAKARSRDKRLLASYGSFGGKLHADVILVAFNMGLTSTPDSQSEDREPDWSNFHSGENDYKLAAAIEEAAGHQLSTGSPVADWLTGAYMTDFYKGLPTKNVKAFEAFSALLTPAEAAAINAEMVRLLRYELEVLGGGATLIPVGGDVRDCLTKHAPDLRVARSPLDHYARWNFDHDDYRQQVLAINAEIHSVRAGTA